VPPTSAFGFSVSVTFLALNWFAVLFGRVATSFRPSTKYAYRDESDAPQAHRTHVQSFLRIKVNAQNVVTVNQDQAPIVKCQGQVTAAASRESPIFKARIPHIARWVPAAWSPYDRAMARISHRFAGACGLFFYCIAKPSFGFESKCETFQEAPPATSGRPCKRPEECARCDEFGLVSPPATRELKGA
jgi:hypothetical protein